jgi:hypothetical protein
MKNKRNGEVYNTIKIKRYQKELLEEIWRMPENWIPMLLYHTPRGEGVINVGIRQNKKTSKKGARQKQKPRRTTYTSF